MVMHCNDATKFNTSIGSVENAHRRGGVHVLHDLFRLAASRSNEVLPASQQRGLATKLLQISASTTLGCVVS
jgi:hypothetical protein